MSSNMPPNSSADGPEYLEQGSGDPIGRESRGSRRKPLLIGAAAVVGVALVGGGVFAATQLSGGGAQPSEALPANTLGYVSIDLDPSAGQKIEAIQTLNKFPSLKKEMGMDADEDVRRRLFEEMQKDDQCAGVDYEQDVEPWLGDRAAAAMLEVGGKTTGVGVVAVTDAEAAEEGVATLRQECGGGEEGGGDVVVSGEWAVIAEDEKTAQRVIDGAENSTLADDEDFTRWIDEVGDPGIMTMYAAPEAGAAMAEAFTEVSSAAMEQNSASSSMYSEEEQEQLKEDMIAAGMSETEAEEYVETVTGGSASSSANPLGADPEQYQEEVTTALKDFRGMAGTVRFDDGALELEVAAESGGAAKDFALGDQGGDLVGSLPADTVAAFGLDLPEGWGQLMLDQLESYSGGEIDAEEMIQQMEAESGLSIPEDVETLTGDAMVLALGDGFDPEAFANSTDGSDIPVGVKVRGEAGEVEGVLDQIRTSAGIPEDGPLLSKSEGDTVAIGPNADYLDQLLAEGDLAGSEVYADVTGGQEDAGMVLFVNFNAADNWLAEMAGDDAEVKRNLEPLGGLGMTAWMEDSVNHTTIRLTTE